MVKSRGTHCAAVSPVSSAPARITTSAPGRVSDDRSYRRRGWRRKLDDIAGHRCATRLPAAMTTPLPPVPSGRPSPGSSPAARRSARCRSPAPPPGTAPAGPARASPVGAREHSSRARRPVVGEERLAQPRRQLTGRAGVPGSHERFPRLPDPRPEARTGTTRRQNHRPPPKARFPPRSARVPAAVCAAAPHGPTWSPAFMPVDHRPGARGARWRAM